MNFGRWSPGAARDPAGCQFANYDLLDAVRALGSTVEGPTRRPDADMNFGREERGSVYDAPLELRRRSRRQPSREP